MIIGMKFDLANLDSKKDRPTLSSIKNTSKNKGKINQSHNQHMPFSNETNQTMHHGTNQTELRDSQVR